MSEGLTANCEISHYRIISKIGAGGMGEVYSATDSRLDRKVAIKVLPSAFANDPGRFARFEQEARATSALNHPNILTVYDIGAHNGSPYIVSELLDGTELRQVLDYGAMPERKAIDYARQIARGLAAAHDMGVVHRDLKPENIFILSGGHVKILDLGLAKLRSPRGETSGSEIATRKQITDPGTVMGTAGYMSPEQVRGLEADHRSDIFSLGAVLYEMLSGRRAFQQETVAETMTAVLRSEPESLVIGSGNIGPQVARIVERCLEKQPEQRFQSAHDLEFALGPLSLSTSSGMRAISGTDFAPPRSRRKWASREALGWIAAAFLLFAAALGAGYWYRGRGDASPAMPRQFDLAVAKAGPLFLGSAPAMLISPDGTRLVATLRVSGSSQLFQRELSEPEWHPISGTNGARDPSFSPDGSYLAFFAGGALKMVPLMGGAAETVHGASNARGGVWETGDRLIYTPGTDTPLFRVRAEGGTAEAASTLDVSAGERSHRWPDMLPGGRHVLFSVVYETGNPLDNSNIAVLDLQTGKHKVLVKGGAFPRYSPTGHIIYTIGRSLFAVPFDTAKVEIGGPPFTLRHSVVASSGNGRAQFSFSRTGDLVFMAPNPDEKEAGQVDGLTWVSRLGEEAPIPGTRDRFSKPKLGDGGQTLYVEMATPEAAVWAYDLRRGTRTRLTRSGVSYGPVPAPHGKLVAYEAVRDGVAGVLVANADGSSEKRLTATKHFHFPSSWSPDGRLLAITAGTERDYSEIWLINMDNVEEPPVVLITGNFNSGAARFSPDGRWIAYVSDESGRNEVYVRPYPGEASRVQVSVDGGAQPVWSPDGRELFFRRDRDFFAAKLRFTPNIEVENTGVLFSKDFGEDSSGPMYQMEPDYDVSPESRKFIFARQPQTDSSLPTATVILNWFGQMKQPAEHPR